jgi:hypothetical protein
LVVVGRSGGGLLDLGLDRDQVPQFLGRDAAAGLAGDVAGPGRGKQGLGWAVVMSRWASPGSSSANNRRTG